QRLLELKHRTELIGDSLRDDISIAGDDRCGHASSGGGDSFCRRGRCERSSFISPGTEWKIIRPLSSRTGHDRRPKQMALRNIGGYGSYVVLSVESSAIVTRITRESPVRLAFTL